MARGRGPGTTQQVGYSAYQQQQQQQQPQYAALQQYQQQGLVQQQAQYAEPMYPPPQQAQYMQQASGQQHMGPPRAQQQGPGPGAAPLGQYQQHQLQQVANVQQQIAGQRGAQQQQPQVRPSPVGLGPTAAAAAHARLEDFDIGTIISKGSFGIVYRAVRRSDGRVFALKQVPLTGMNRVDREEAIDEARVLAQLDHPHIVRHYDSFIDSSDMLNILMEFASKGSLSAMVKGNGGRGLQEDFIWKVAIQSLLALQHIHGKKIIHRDIKSLNIFLDSNDNVKIGDLGIARALSPNSNFARTIVGTPYYLSPELCEDKPYNERSDVWALGVVLYECCMGCYPFDAQNEGALIRKILRGVYAPVTGYTPSLASLVASCLTFKPTDRPDTAGLLRNAALVAKARSLGVSLTQPPPAAAAMRGGGMAAAPPPGAPGTYEGAPTYEPRPGVPHQGGNGQQQAHVLYNVGVQEQQGYGAQYSPAQQQRMDQQLQYDGGQQNPGRAGYGSAQQPAPGQRYEQGAMQPPPHMFGAANGRGGSPHAAMGPPSPSGHGGYGGQPGAQQQPRQLHLFDLPPSHGQQQQGLNSPGRYQQQQGRQDWDAVAEDMERLMAPGQRQALHKGERDNCKGLMYNDPPGSGPRQARLEPDLMPPAGQRGQPHSGKTPWAVQGSGNADMYTTNAQRKETTAWSATLQAPQYGRKRNPDLMITGPSLRGPNGGAMGGTGRGYTPAADDATTYVSTSYHTSYH